MGYSLTQALLASDTKAYETASKPEFASLAYKGEVPKSGLSQWLKHDRVYLHSYLKTIGGVIRDLNLPDTNEQPEADTLRFSDWLITLLWSVRREDRTIIDTAQKYSLDINAEVGADGHIKTKSASTKLFEDLFSSISCTNEHLGWFDFAIMFYGIERAYHDAWLWGKTLNDESKATSSDLDGGALRDVLTVSWTSKEFGEFLVEMERLLDEVVARETTTGGEETREELFECAKRVWDKTIAIQAIYWQL